MKTVYEAANALEAHMLVDLLKQEGVVAHIRGEHLQGAVGEVPAVGLVRLDVDESQFAQARHLIDRWNAAQPASGPSVGAAVAGATPASKGGSRLGIGLLVGVAIGLAAGYVFYRVPVGADGIDHNGDGIVDEQWVQSAAGAPARYEVDRNLDGKVDFIGHYGRQGAMTSAEQDDDFNGTFETATQYANGGPSVTESDTDGDGFRDLRSIYRHGVLASCEYIDPTSGQVRKVEHFTLGVLTRSELDTDRDGRFDVSRSFGAMGEPASAGGSVR